VVQGEEVAGEHRVIRAAELRGWMGVSKVYSGKTSEENRSEPKNPRNFGKIAVVLGTALQKMSYTGEATGCALEGLLGKEGGTDQNIMSGGVGYRKGSLGEINPLPPESPI